MFQSSVLRNAWETCPQDPHCFCENLALFSSWVLKATCLTNQNEEKGEEQKGEEKQSEKKQKREESEGNNART